MERKQGLGWCCLFPPIIPLLAHIFTQFFFAHPLDFLPLDFYQSRLDAFLNNPLENFPEHFMTVKAATAVLGECGMVGNLSVKIQSQKPAVSDIVFYLFLQFPFLINIVKISYQ